MCEMERTRRKFDLTEGETLAFLSKRRTFEASAFGADVEENRLHRDVKVSECLHFYDLESELSHKLFGIRPNGECGRVEPELSPWVQTVPYLVLYLGCCTLGPGPSRGQKNG